MNNWTFADETIDRTLSLSKRALRQAQGSLVSCERCDFSILRNIRLLIKQKYFDAINKSPGSIGQPVRMVTA